MAMASVKQRVMVDEDVVVEVADDAVTLSIAEAPRLFTESMNPRLLPVENLSVQFIREAVSGADAVAELLLTDAFHASEAKEDGAAYQPLSSLAVEGLHIALRSLLRDARGRLETLARN